MQSVKFLKVSFDCQHSSRCSIPALRYLWGVMSYRVCNGESARQSSDYLTWFRSIASQVVGSLCYEVVLFH